MRKTDMIKLENNKYFSYDMIGEFHSSGKWIHPRRTIDSFEIILVIEGMLYIAVFASVPNSISSEPFVRHSL